MDALFSWSIVLLQYSHTLSQILSLKWGKKNLVVIMGMSDCRQLVILFITCTKTNPTEPGVKVTCELRPLTSFDSSQLWASLNPNHCPHPFLYMHLFLKWFCSHLMSVMGELVYHIFLKMLQMWITLFDVSYLHSVIKFVTVEDSVVCKYENQCNSQYSAHLKHEVCCFDS